MEIADNNLQLPTDPMEGLSLWLKEAESGGMPEPTAMTLATVSPSGQPSARIVLFKGFSQQGGERFPRFFTNYESRKSREMETNPHVCLVFHWAKQERQIRIEGVVEKLSRDESDGYFQSRARGSRIGAWASPQSRPIASRSELEKLVSEFETKFKEGDVPLPPYWGGWRVRPTRVEFWNGGSHRLHDRFAFEKTSHGWNVSRLAP